MKRWIALFLCLGLLVSQTACAGGKTLDVITPVDGRVSIRPGEIDDEEFRRVYSAIGRYDTYYVSLKSGELLISDLQDVQLPKLSFARCEGGYFLGLFDGEFDGWVSYVPYDRDFHDEEPQLVLEENCRGLYRVDAENILVFTGLAHMFTNYGMVYHMQKTGDAFYGLDAWTRTELAVLDGVPLVFLPCEEDEILYIATNNGLCALEKDGSLRSFAVPAAWGDM